MSYGKKRRNGKSGENKNMVSQSKFWDQRNVFVTGASGFLGSYLVEKLVNLGANVIAIIRDNTPYARLYYENINDNIVTVRGDIRNYFLLERILNEYEIDVVFHLAAQTIVPIANKLPISTFESNIKGTWNLLEATRNSSNVKRIIVASTDKAYGEKAKLPYFETDPLNAKHPYDLSKAVVDMMCQGYADTYKLPVGITRCGNLYGGGDLNFNRIIPQTIRHILFGENPIIRSDGTYLRDYFYVGDAADSYIIFAENLLEKNLVGEAFNFGTEKPISVIDLVNKLISLSGKKYLNAVIENKIKGEIKNQYLSCKKAHDLLQWKPMHTLDEGLELTYHWYEEWFKNKKNG